MRHPSASLLTCHATGDLPAAAWIVVDAHLDACPRCAAVVAEAEEAEGERLAQTAPIALSPDILDRVLAGLNDTPTSVPPPRNRLGDVDLPRAVAEAGVGRRRWLAPGLWSAFVDTAQDDGWRAFILRMPAGGVVPRHGHKGAEFICVLSGAFSDGRRYKTGDFAELDEDDEHALRAGPDEPCVCLIAVERGFRWKGMARLLAPVLGL
jgi:putative transcriptional regulator